MEAASIQEYERLERYYWWFVGRRMIIDRVLNRFFEGRQMKILDWGCGPGGNFQFLERYGRVTGVDASEESLRACREKGITSVVRAETTAEFRPTSLFDLVTGFDVVEHIKDDEHFLREVAQYLIPRGHVLVTVPAYQFLWTHLDDVLGHQRRYIRKELLARFRHNGYEIVFASYFVFLLSPAFIIYRLLEKIWQRGKRSAGARLADSVIPLPPAVNWLFTKTLAFEAFLLQYTSFPFGTSITVLARKI